MNRFKITKIGLLNFWFYDEEEFDFYGGNLILRGSNGSGKSVTMQSFIPLILDGNKSPDRLDPFGSKERKIEDYILGDADGIQKEEAISYLYMETYNEEEKKYITIGLGFRGRKGKPVDSWGFALKDGRRVNKDFYLYKDALNKIPLSKNELKARLDQVNEFTDTMKEYKEMVNRLLFGFPNTDTYDEFIKLLLQLRSNKLSKDYKPTHLVTVLNSVLQPLTEEDLRPLADSIEQMNKTKEQVELLEKNSKALKDFLRVYKNYNETILLTKARNFQNITDEYNKLTSEKTTLTKNVDILKNSLQEKNNRFLKVDEEIKVNNETKRQLDNQDLKEKINSLTNINASIETLNQKIKELENKLDTCENDRIDLNKKITDFDNDAYRLKKEIESTVIDLKSLADDAYFDEITFFSDELGSDLKKSISFESIFMSLKRYKEKVNLIMHFLEEEKQINQESETTRIEFEKLLNTYKTLENDIANQERNLKESIMAWQEDFVNKENNNSYIKLDDQTKTNVFELMNNYSRENYELAKNIYHDFSQELINKYVSDNLKLEQKRIVKEEELNQVKNDYENLLNAKDIELPILNSKTDELLNEQNIPNIPLYKCIEFKKEVSENVKNRLESALINLNIINAKIINEEDIEKVKKLDSEIIFLTKTTKKEKNILKYVNITLDSNSKIKEQTIKNILESISISESDDIFISGNGLSKIDNLNTISNKEYEQTFIGYLKRIELKNKRLKELENNIDVITKTISNINNLINSNNDKISIIQNEKENFPTNELITNIENKISDLTRSLNWNDNCQKELEKELVVIDKKLKDIKEKIDENKQRIYIPLNLESYKNVANLLLNINEILQELKTSHNSYLSKLELKNNLQERMDDVLINTSYLKADKQEKETELSVKITSRDTINALLNTEKYINQKEKLLEAENNLISLAKEKDMLIREVAKLETDVAYSEKTLTTLIENIKSIEHKKDVYEEIFLREYKLGYIYQEPISNIYNTVKEIIKDGKQKKEISVNDALNNFYSSYNHYSLELNDYSLRSVTLFSDFDATDESVRKIYEDNTRVDVTSMYQGFKLNIIELSKKLELDIEESKDLISKQDRHLFEDILLNTVGEKIRNRINASNEWVEKINKIMETMQENSALSFKLVWKSISAENDGEIDTKELVRILKMDPTILKESDANKLTNHFRSKIKKAEELYQDSYISFYKIIEEVLDYRSWFTFQLLYQRKGMPQKELTDKTFAKFSGGERAKSMYIPLFASVFTKYNLARKNALRIIALDEAFAGVDDDNIREMFGILKYLELNFIINSQFLWGDYDTVSDISISELIRPQNSSVITVERYRWNGKYKEIVNDRISYNKELENA